MADMNPSYTPAPNIPGMEPTVLKEAVPAEAVPAVDPNVAETPPVPVLQPISPTPTVELSPTLKVASPEVQEPPTVADWYFDEKVPGTGEKPEWFNDKTYKTIADQAKAQLELRKKLSNFTGAPEEGYDVKLGEDLKGLEVNYEDPLLEGFAQFAQDMNMSEDGFNDVVNWFIKEQSSALEMKAEAQEKYRLDEIEKLGPNVEEDCKILGQWGKNNLPAELHDTFTEMLFSSNSIKVFQTILDKVIPSQLTHVAPGTGLTRAQIREMMQTEAYKRGDPDTVRQVNAEADFLYSTRRNPIYE